MTRDRVIKILAAIAASVIAGYLVFSRITLADLRKLLAHIDARLLIAALGCYLLANYARALRFRLLLGKRVGVLTVLQVVVTQNFLNTFFPLRAGEVSYLYMVHRTGAVSPGTNLASLLGARLLDLVAALTIPLAAMPLSGAWMSDNPSVRWVAAVAVAASLGIAAATAIAIWRSSRLADRIQRWAAARGEGRMSRLLQHLAEAVRALGELRSGHVLGRVTLLSFASWMLLYLASAAILMGTGLSISLADGVFANGFPMLASMTPLYMFGGFGLFEGSVAFGLTLVGVPTDRALATSVIAHVAELSMVVLPAVPIPLLEAYRKRDRLPIDERPSK